MKRRHLLGAATSLAVSPLLTPALIRPAAAQASRAKTLIFVPSAPLTALDPIWTTAAVTRVHGYLVFDSLYGMDAQLRPQPQMAEGSEVSADGLTWTVTLRGGLRFHDGAPVRAQDCVASLKRWAKRSPMGQKLESVTAELVALDERRLRFVLKKPFPQLLHALGSVGPQAAIMPERLAATSPFEQVREIIGSGPYSFRQEEFVSGSRAVYERFSQYVPAPSGEVSLTAGPKVAHFDRVVWNMIPDPATAAAALRSGEVDWYEQPPPELADAMRRDRNLTVEKLDRFPQVPGLRFNHLHGPFNNKALRQAVLPAFSQSDVAISVVGDNKDLWQENVGVFTPGTASASAVGLEPLAGRRDFDLAKKLMREAGYKGEPMRQLAPTDLPSVTAVSQVVADVFQRLGFTLDLALSDWGTVVQRRASREPLDKGGWSVFCTTFSWFEFADPAVNIALRGNGSGAYFGWPDVPQLETLREDWFEAPDEAARKAKSEEIQRVAMAELPFIPLGATFLTTAHRRDLSGRVLALPLFWNIRRG
ncbi:ABC transporter substrate-binding protein [Pseudoroseomonas deserti]|uniref:ABC transporter substrate-binding protein n=1 Tax=Teichococcus deserti TaxID=1817963 RepID=A0A1V2H9Y5_9PROT|nr:ABC transporter substrate-binding protein [Pseudoroseomonas deserti]ONG58880.1 ABC transporter substrate-binding protein [Pseudoroseomonas deserti]